jgi:demethylmenaquinone methyltransferase / 2-methoxy-6-polyprenyl-1,4-benzoquinol methylase
MTLYSKENPSTIQAMFGSIASQYDKTNAVLSFGLNSLWNRKLALSLHSTLFADLCCGTGAIAFRQLRGVDESCTGYLIDFCPEMLAYAQARAERMNMMQHSLKYIQADVQEIPLPNQCITSATMAYGIRNVKEPLRCLREVHRLLKPGGRFGILELTEPSNPLLRFGHRLYLKTMLPVLGKLLTSNQEAYSYLCNSIQSFIKPQELAKLMGEAGFVDIEVKPLHGGIATLIIGRVR